MITICAGLTGAELAAAIPKTGGMMTYIDRTYGSFASFLLGWAQIIIYVPANIAALSVIFGVQVVNLYALEETMIIPVAVAAAVSIMFINFLGAKAGGILQSITLVFKLIPLALIIIFGFLREGQVEFSLFPVVAGEGRNFMAALGGALLATMFAYDGWIHVGSMAGELKNPQRDLPRAITLGLLLVMVIYLLVNLAFLLSVPVGQIAGNENAASEAARVLFGDMGGKLITIGILISVYGTINGYTMTGMRIPYAMALENKLPFSHWFKRLSTKTKIPYNSAIFTLVIAVSMMFFGGFDLLTDMLIFVIWIFYSMTFAAVIILRQREPRLHRPYKVPLYPIIPITALLGGIFIVVNTLFTQTGLALFGLFLTALGIPVYFYQKAQNSRSA
jgi:APA family basic amino acid/polyamine antiporter